MTVSSQIRAARSACNGATTVFGIPFQFIEPGDIAVSISASPLSIGAPLSEGTDYTITGDGRAGTARVTTKTVYPNGRYLWRWRDTARAQTADYVPNDGFPAEDHETQLDRLTLVDQELADDLGRAVSVPIGEDGVQLPRIATRRGTIAIYDQAGDPAASAIYDVMSEIGVVIHDDGRWSGTIVQFDDGVWG